MKKNLNVIGVLVLLIALLSNIFIGVANASTTSDFDNEEVKSSKLFEDKTVEKAFKGMEDISKSMMEVTDQSIIEKLKENVHNLIDTEKVIVTASKSDLDFENITVMQLAQNGKEYASVTLPIESDTYSVISNITFVFNKNLTLSTYSESLITKSDEDKFIISNYMDGQLIELKNTDVDYLSNQELKKGLVNLQQIGNAKQTRGVGAVAACLAATLGVTGAVGYLIAGTCTAACLTINPVCAACVGGIVALGGIGVSGIVGCFGLL